MFRFLLSCFLWLAGLSAAFAQCAGTDLRTTLSPEERDRFEALLAELPYAQGNRWRAEKDGEVIHLVGTLHISDPRLDAPLERLRPLISGAGALLLESPQAEQARMMNSMAERPELLFLTENTLPELMSEDAWQKLADAARARGIPPFMAAKFQPWYLSMMLALPACAKAAMEARDGLDFRLEALAEAEDVPRIALEPFEAVLNIFNGYPLDEQIETMTLALASQDDGEDALTTTIEAYFDEKAGEVWKFSEIVIARSGLYTPDEIAEISSETTDAVLTQRNINWIPVILKAAAESDKPIVVAFGAAHLPGEEGVLNLLAQEGFTLTREAF